MAIYYTWPRHYAINIVIKFDEREGHSGHSLISDLIKCFYFDDWYVKMIFNPYPAGTESDKPLPPVSCQANKHIHAVWPGSMLLADQLQVHIFLFPKMIMVSSKKWKVDYSI